MLDQNGQPGVAAAPGLAVVVPVYNSAEALPELLARLRAVLMELGREYEVILVNDCSLDGSWEVIRTAADSDPRLTAINLSRNFGQHNALLCGLRAVRLPVVVTIDDDLQHPPEEIPKLLNTLEDGTDVVYGVPEKGVHGVWRNLASRTTKFAMRSSMGIQTAPDVSAFRAFRRSLCDGFADYRGSYVSVDVLLTWSTTSFASVRVRHDERRLGKSNYTVIKLVTHAFNMITGFSSLPLRISSLVGFVFTLFGALVLVFVVVRYLLSGTSIPGFPFLASTVAIFAGAQLFALGIIGEYLARVYSRTMDRPTYVVREVSGGLERRQSK